MTPVKWAISADKTETRIACSVGKGTVWTAKTNKQTVMNVYIAEHKHQAISLFKFFCNEILHFVGIINNDITRLIISITITMCSFL